MFIISCCLFEKGDSSYSEVPFCECTGYIQSYIQCHNHHQGRYNVAMPSAWFCATLIIHHPRLAYPIDNAGRASLWPLRKTEKREKEWHQKRFSFNIAAQYTRSLPKVNAVSLQNSGRGCSGAALSISALERNRLTSSASWTSVWQGKILCVHFLCNLFLAFVEMEIDQQTE